MKSGIYNMDDPQNYPLDIIGNALVFFLRLIQIADKLCGLTISDQRITCNVAKASYKKCFDNIVNTNIFN